ncbi:MAG: VOC family protein [bacterium]|nr:VOC family protein [bacterium]
MKPREGTAAVRARGVDAIFYSVKDVQRALAFYRELLEVREVTWESDHGAEFILPDGTAFGIGAYSSGEWKPSGCVLFAVADIEAAAARVVGLGGRLDGEVRSFPACRAQWCEDPDGNVFVLHLRTA